MSYSDFKTFDQIKSKLGIDVKSGGSLFENTKTVKASELLTNILYENLSLALNINTEKARSELIIAPVLVEVRKLLDRKISLFSGLEFNVDEKKGLNGFCDFILSQSPDQIFLEFPVMCIVEAKNENLKSGYAQCAAEMIASEIFNNKHSYPVKYILGVVTTGSNWKFLKLENGTVYIDFDEYLISQIDQILGIIKTALD
ncbi:hypothetical protein PN36_12505 [Candidatus Thiomargarita nelsonii]|uniref:Type I restriction enzyme R protein N-terminal domain-containing protein n=1 Tax=Candidatus Thiomargarita nelsonii TaxID=1003181 RepID=A0A0A6RWT5_9GAMM|nr:hypothetical protein PN36_12505 [Candidatus Thiomargarita nelsonii]